MTYAALSIKLCTSPSKTDHDKEANESSRCWIKVAKEVVSAEQRPNQMGSSLLPGQNRNRMLQRWRNPIPD